MTISYVGATNRDSNVALVVPAGVQAGDFLVVARSSYPNDAPPALPSGWTMLTDYTAPLDANNPAESRLVVWTKVATASDTPGSTILAGSADGNPVYFCAAYRNVVGGVIDNWDVAGFTLPGTGHYAVYAYGPDIPSSSSETLAIGISTISDYNTDDDVAQVTGTGWTEIIDAAIGPNNNNNTSSFGLVLAHKTVGVGDVGQATYQWNAGGGYASMTAATIILKGNVAPNAPTLTGPTSGEILDRGAANRFSWTFSDPDAGDSQSDADLRYRLVGAATWTTLAVDAPTGYLDVAAGTFAAGDYEWQVRTADSVGIWGPWSSSGFFTAGTAPATPTITDPINGQVVGADEYLVQWSAPAQTSYQLQVLDGGLVEYDTGETNAPTTRAHLTPFPVNTEARTIRVRVKDAGLWSSWYSVGVTVSFSPPAVPGVALQAVGTTIVVQVTNPTPTGETEPTVTHNEVHVDDGLDDGETHRANVPANGTWTYYTPRSGLDYDPLVRVVAVGDNGIGRSSA